MTISDIGAEILATEDKIDDLTTYLEDLKDRQIMAEHAKATQPKEPLHKYDTGELTDPLVRCHNCTKLVSMEFIGAHGGCNHCGNRRMTQIRGMTGEEIAALEEKNYDLGVPYEIDPEFLEIFEPVGGAA